MTNMNIQKRDLRPYTKNLIRFSRKLMFIEGMVKVKVTPETCPLVVNMDVDFLVIDTLNMVYNAIMGKT